MSNKAAYLELRDAMIGGDINKVDDEEYYVLHSTSYENLLDILKTGKLMANKYLPPEKRRMSGDNDKDHVFATITQKSHMNIDNFGYGLIFSKKLLKENKFYFNSSWAAYPHDNSIIFVPNDPDYQSKISSVFDILRTHDYPYKHEILFEDEVSLKYLIGVHCPSCGFEEVDQIRKIIGYKIPIILKFKIPMLKNGILS